MVLVFRSGLWPAGPHGLKAAYRSQAIAREPDEPDDSRFSRVGSRVAPTRTMLG